MPSNINIPRDQLSANMMFSASKKECEKCNSMVKGFSLSMFADVVLGYSLPLMMAVDSVAGFKMVCPIE